MHPSVFLRLTYDREDELISVVIPVFNNGSTLRELSGRICETLDGRAFEIVFVNDGSCDNSLDVLKGLVKDSPQIRAISLSRNYGQHEAISAGFENVRGEYIILMDADLQDKPENIPTLLAQLNDDVDIVYTVMEEPVKGCLTLVTSRLYHYCFSKLTNMGVPKNVGTFRAFNRKVLNALRKYPERKILYGPLMFYIGFKTCIIEIDRHNSPDQKSSYTFTKRLALAVDSLITYTNLPYKIFSWTGTLVLLGVGAYAIIVVLQYFFMGRHLPEGLTLVLVYLSILTGSVLLCMGILGIYLFRIFQEVLRRPRYLVDEVIEAREPEAQ